MTFPTSVRALLISDRRGGWLPGVRTYRYGVEVDRTVATSRYFGYGDTPLTWDMAADLACQLTNIARLGGNILPILLGTDRTPPTPTSDEPTP